MTKITVRNVALIALLLPACATTGSTASQSPQRYLGGRAAQPASGPVSLLESGTTPALETNFASSNGQPGQWQSERASADTQPASASCYLGGRAAQPQSEPVALVDARQVQGALCLQQARRGF